MYFDFRNVCKILNQVFRIARSKVFICEQHTDGKHFYNGKWVHNYKKILYKIKEEEGGGYGNLIKIHTIEDN